MKILAASILLCAFSPEISQLKAGVIFREDFDGSESVKLAQTEPTVTTGKVTWKALSIFNKDGSISPSTSGGSAFLPFVPSSGAVYRLKGELVIEAESDRWIAIGFFSNAAVGTRHTEGGLIWVLHRLSEKKPNQSAYFSTPEKELFFNSELKTQQLEVEIVLDTTSEENVILTIKLNDSSTLVTGQDIGSLKRLGVKAVGISYADGCLGSFGSFELSSDE